MPTPNKNYRENPKRCVYVSGKIDQSLVDKITPTINELRLENTEPITVYIDSPGGSIVLAETIRHHLKAPNPDGKQCRLITVATSRAASAAADLFALGDYSIAYPYSDLVYHGASRSPDTSITTEMATIMARGLQQTNEICAVRLARHTFPRFILRLTQLKDEFSKYVADPSQLIGLTQALQRKLSSANVKLVRDARRKQMTIGSLSHSVFKHSQKFKRQLSPTEFECEMLRAIVKYKARQHKKDFWFLSETGLQEVTEDFNLLHDFHFGSQKRDLEKWEKTYGEIFLSDGEKQERNNLTGTDEDKNKWLVQKSEPKLRPIWYLMVSICRLLQGDDYTLPADEAYWLGLADEVPGSDLPSIRESEENSPAKNSAK